MIVICMIIKKKMITKVLLRSPEFPPERMRIDCELHMRRRAARPSVHVELGTSFSLLCPLSNLPYHEYSIGATVICVHLTHHETLPLLFPAVPDSA